MEDKKLEEERLKIVKFKDDARFYYGAAIVSGLTAVAVILLGKNGNKTDDVFQYVAEVLGITVASISGIASICFYISSKVLSRRLEKEEKHLININKNLDF